MPPNCTSPDKDVAKLIDPKGDNGQNLYFNPVNSRTDETNVEKKKNSQVEVLINDIPELNSLFSIHSKIGEGTFSSVYLATLKSDNSQEKKFAIKHLIPTCHPNRIKFELECLKRFGGRNNVIGIELCLRSKINTVFVMPYQPHKPFADFIGKMDAKETSEYIKNLLIALETIHEQGIIHRDIKASNFLYDRRKRRYVLVDFGLAQHVPVRENITESTSLKRKRESFSPNFNGKVKQPSKRPNIETISPTSGNIYGSSLKSHTKLEKENKAKFIENETLEGFTKKEGGVKGSCHCYGKPRVCSHCLVRPSIQANRAGTPGFRPPEVLIKYPDQTTAVDIWAVGVIFLSILSNCPSFFTSLNDNIALAEIISLFGSEKINKLSQKLGRHFLCSERKEPINLKKFCHLLRNRSGTKSEQNYENTDTCVKCSKASLYCMCTSSNQDTTDLFPDSAFNLLYKFLDVDPMTRITAKDALAHEFLHI